MSQDHQGAFTDAEMLELLKCNARVGLDCSPGDPVAAWAVQRIERLTGEVKALERNIQQPNLERAG